MLEEEKEKRAGKTQGVIIAKFSKISDRQHYRFRKLREQQKRYTLPKNYIQEFIFNLHKTKDTEKRLREAKSGGKEDITYTGKKRLKKAVFLSETMQAKR